MIPGRLPWVPIIVTTVLLYFARFSQVAVLHYNLFLVSLMVWVAVLFAFYRILTLKTGPGGRRDMQWRWQWKN